MRFGDLCRTTWFWFALCILLAVPELASAGLYNPCEVDEGPFLKEFYDKERNNGFRVTYLKYYSCSAPGVKVENPFRQRYLLMEELQKTGRAPLKEAIISLHGKIQLYQFFMLMEELQKSGDLREAFRNVADVRPLADELIRLQDEFDLRCRQALSLSEYLIRRNKAIEAYELLLPQSSMVGDNFLILANLAMACQQMAEADKNEPDYQKAIFYQKEALKLWPHTWKELTEKSPKLRILWEEIFRNQDPAAAFLRCRTAEEYFLKLLQSRQARRKATQVSVDALFPLKDSDTKTIRYVGDNGKFSPGKLAAGEKAKLPNGDIDAALAIVQQLVVWLPMDSRLYWQMGELYNARGGPDDLRAAQSIFDELVQNFNERSPEVMKRWPILNNFRIPPGPPRSLPITLLEPDNTDNRPKKGTDDSNKGSSDTQPLPLGWNTVAIAFGLGFVLAVFGQWQLREILRRRSLSRRP